MKEPAKKPKPVPPAPAEKKMPCKRGTVPPAGKSMKHKRYPAPNLFTAKP